MAYRAWAALTAASVVLALAPLDAAHAVRLDTDDSGVIPASDVGTTVIRFREEWDPATVASTNGVAAPFVGSFDAAVDEFMGLQIEVGSYDVTAFDGETSGEVELTVPVGATLATGTYTTDALDTATDAPGFFFHGYKGYAGNGTGSFTVVRSSYDPDTGALVSFYATYDEVLDDSLGDSHVVGDVSWADTGDVPQVAQVQAAIAMAGRQVTVSGTLDTTVGPGGTLTVTRTSHGRTSALPDLTTEADGSFALSDRPPCAGGVTYVVSAPTTADLLGESATLTIPLVRCTTAGGPGPVQPRKHHHRVVVKHRR
jgi:hypothetical protein